jgi:hypothetical protein
MYNYSESTVNYENDKEFRQCLRRVFRMDQNIDNSEYLDEITRDENNYDFESATKAMDYVFEETQSNPLFQTLYDLAAGKMFSSDRSIGLAVLFSYDNLKDFHYCLWDCFTNKESFNENSISYKTMFNKIK